jgi:hypothetical protein
MSAANCGPVAILSGQVDPAQGIVLTDIAKNIRQLHCGAQVHGPIESPMI